ncbi:MAG: hypothetical protein U0031_05175 [Thermomicrobiales bacterium]
MTSRGGSTAISFTDRVNRLQADLRRDGLPFADMRRAPALELQFAGVDGLGDRQRSTRAEGVEPLEGPIVARQVPVIAPRESRLRYFLDGAQRTFAVMRCGLIPIAATVVAAGILKRPPGGAGEIERGTLRLEHCWLIPEGLDGRVDDLLARIRSEGMRVEDPRFFGRRANGVAGADDDIDYGRLHELAYTAARTVRDELEQDVLTSWVSREDWANGEDWIVVDGRLRSYEPRAIGLVKQFSDAYLSGASAETLLGLQPGHRTTAFHPKGDRRRGNELPEARTLWYLRLWDSAGLDARHALVRVEARSAVTTTDEIDRISSWVLAERTPRATGDARWATLLYPVHLLERMLKRALDADTRGWPGA